MIATLPRVEIEEELLSLRQAAAELGVSHVQVWRLVRAGRLPVVRIPQGSKPALGIRRAALEAFKATRRGPGRPRST
jgi:excisionase family DNA binding protein